MYLCARSFLLSRKSESKPVIDIKHNIGNGATLHGINKRDTSSTLGIKGHFLEIMTKLSPEGCRKQR